MPTIFRHKGFRFAFFSNEGDPREPPHVHVVKDEADAKFWLVPTVEMAYNRGHSARVVRELEEIVKHRRMVCLEVWNEFFSQG